MCIFCTGGDGLLATTDGHTTACVCRAGHEIRTGRVVADYPWDVVLAALETAAQSPWILDIVRERMAGQGSGRAVAVA